MYPPAPRLLIAIRIIYDVLEVVFAWMKLMLLHVMRKTHESSISHSLEMSYLRLIGAEAAFSRPLQVSCVTLL
jgi:hypothetical protein